MKKSGNRCFSAVISFLFSVVSVFSTSYAVSAETAPLLSVSAEITNGGFEEYAVDRPIGWMTYCEWGENYWALGIDYNTYNGSTAAKLTKNESGDFYIISDPSGAYGSVLYSFGAYIKTENADGCRMYVMLTQYLTNGETVVSVSESLCGNVSEYTAVIGSVFTDPEVWSISISVVITDENEGSYSENVAVMYVDDAFLTRHTPQITSASSNFGFEQTVADENGVGYPLGWRLNIPDGFGVSPSIRTDETLCHGGAHSLFFGKAEDTAAVCIENTELTQISGAGQLEWGIMYAAESNAQLRLKLLVYDSAGTLLETHISPDYTLSAVGQDWQRLATVSKLHEDAAQLGFSIEVGKGYTQLWADDIFFEEYTAHVSGDITGDGLVGSADLTLIRKVLLGIILKEGKYDINGDNNIDIIDLIKLKKNIAE